MDAVVGSGGPLRVMIGGESAYFEVVSGSCQAEGVMARTCGGRFWLVKAQKVTFVRG